MNYKSLVIFIIQLIQNCFYVVGPLLFYYIVGVEIFCPQPISPEPISLQWRFWKKIEEEEGGEKSIENNSQCI